MAIDKQAAIKISIDTTAAERNLKNILSLMDQLNGSFAKLARSLDSLKFDVEA